MNILILITTFDRTDELNNLINQLEEYNNTNLSLDIVIWDDCITNRFKLKNEYSNIKIFQNKENRGKKKFWITWNEMFDYCKNNKHDFYLFLQDDMSICDDFFNKLISIWNSLKNPITLSPVMDNNTLVSGISRWGGIKFIKYNKYATLTNFVDCKMLITDNFFEKFGYSLLPINKDRWKINKNLSSGVGEQITKRLQSLKLNMYHVTPSLCNILNIDSKMNYEERLLTPLYTNIKEQLKFLNKNKIIVSFTSYKERLPYVHLMVKSLLENTMKAYKIVITLYKEDVQYITKELQTYIDNKELELIICDEDIRPHKKYFYAMQKYKEYPIITVDDDAYYSKDLIESLYKSYIKNPKCIHGRRARIIKYDSNGNCRPYSEWTLNTSITGQTEDILFTGVGGVLYPSNALNICDKNLEEIKKYITVDDIYLYYLAMINGYKNVWVNNSEITPKSINETQKTALYLNDNKGNICENNNDVAIKSLINPLKKKESSEIQLSIIQDKVENEKKEKIIENFLDTTIISTEINDNKPIKSLINDTENYESNQLVENDAIINIDAMANVLDKVNNKSFKTTNGDFIKIKRKTITKQRTFNKPFRGGKSHF